jgi:hypothetical protein
MPIVGPNLLSAPAQVRFISAEHLHGLFELTSPSSVGSHLADASVFITCATTLAVFNISKCVENGVVIEPVHDSTTGTIRYGVWTTNVPFVDQ